MNTRKLDLPVVRLLVVLAMLAAFAPFSTDMYLSAFSQMARDFDTSLGNVEATLSAFFLGLALGQAFYGPLIDRYGRRVPLLAGIILFAVATVGCLLTDDIKVLTGLRLLQAVGGCAGMVIGRTIVNDLFDVTESARVLSLLQILMAFAPIAAPLAGGWILLLGGWRSIFVFMLLFSLLCVAMAWRYVPETLPPERRGRLSAVGVLQGYAGLLLRPRFMAPTLAGGFSQACIFAFITGSPGVFMGIYGVSEQLYGWLFGLNALGLIAGAQINRVCLGRWGSEQLLGAGLIINILATAMLVAVANSPYLAVVLVPLWIVTASLGLIAGNATAIAMANSGQRPGSASALIGVLQFGCAFFISSIVARYQNGTAYPMSLTMLGTAVVGGALWMAGLWAQARRRRRRTL